MWIKASLIAVGFIAATAAATPAPTLALPDGNHRASRKHAHDQTLRLAVAVARTRREERPGEVGRSRDRLSLA